MVDEVEPYDPEESTTDQIIDDYKDLPLELVQSSKGRFLTSGDFSGD